MSPNRPQYRIAKLATLTFTYAWIVILVACSEEKETSQLAVAEKVIAIPTAPMSVNVVPGDKQAILSWSRVENASSYTLYIASQSAVSPQSYANGRRLESINSPYIITELENGKTYYLVLTSSNGSGESTPSQAVTVSPVSSIPLPPAPEISFSNGAKNEVELGWSEIPGVFQYYVYVTNPDDVAPEPNNHTEKIAVQSSPYTITELEQNQTYQFAVSAENDAGEGKLSASISVITKPTVKRPASPKGLTASTSDHKTISLSWNISQNVDQYTLIMSSDPNVHSGNFQELADGKAFEAVVPPFELTNLAANTYYFLLSANNDGGISRDSRMVSIVLGAVEKKIITEEETKNSLPNAQARFDSTPLAANSPYEKLGYGGDKLSTQNQNFQTQPWSCVRHKKSGKVWEVKTLDDSFQNWRNTYPWLKMNSSSTNCPEKICDAQDYINKANKMRLCGFTNWRLPTLSELLSLLDKKQSYPTPKIDIRYFINTGSHYYWTSTQYEHDQNMAWFIYYASGYKYFDLKSTPMNIRLVRDSK